MPRPTTCVADACRQGRAPCPCPEDCQGDGLDFFRGLISAVVLTVAIAAAAVLVGVAP